MRIGFVALCFVLGLIALLALGAVIAVLAGSLEAEASVVVLNALQFIAASIAIVGLVRNQAQPARLGTSAIGGLWALEMIVDYLTGGSRNTALATGIIAALTVLLFAAAASYSRRLIAYRLAARPGQG